MESKQLSPITVTATVKASLEKAWLSFTVPEHITQWNFAADEWQCPTAENDLTPGGKFSYRMEAKDGSSGFDFGGIYDEVKPNELLAYTMGDGRKVRVTFTPNGNQTFVEETFDPEGTNPIEMQRDGWQAILDNYKKHTESL